MGKWQKELDAKLKLYAADRKKYEALKKRYQAVVDACNAFTSGYAKASTEIADLFSQLQDNSDQCGRAVAELSVYEDDLAAAKKSKDKKQEKEIQKKMDPLIKTYEASKKEANKIVEDYNKQLGDLKKLFEAINKANA